MPVADRKPEQESTDQHTCCNDKCFCCDWQSGKNCQQRYRARADCADWLERVLKILAARTPLPKGHFQSRVTVNASAALGRFLLAQRANHRRRVRHAGAIFHGAHQASPNRFDIGRMKLDRFPKSGNRFIVAIHLQIQFAYLAPRSGVISVSFNCSPVFGNVFFMKTILGALFQDVGDQRKRRNAADHHDNPRQQNRWRSGLNGPCRADQQSA